MSYNPARQTGSVRPRRQRKLDPRAGVHHKDIIAKNGPSAATVEDLRNREETISGWRVLIFRGDEFEMIYEYICTRNATGQIFHATKDRALRVLSGELFVMINGETAHLRSGSSYAIPKGIEYQLATSGTLDAEVVFSQSSKYEEGLEHRSEPEAVNATTNMVFSEPSDNPPRERASRESSMRYAEKLQEDRKQRERSKGKDIRIVDQQSMAATEGAESVVTSTTRRPPKRAPLAGQQVVGVNPRPVGAGGFGE